MLQVELNSDGIISVIFSFQECYSRGTFPSVGVSPKSWSRQEIGQRSLSFFITLMHKGPSLQLLTVPIGVIFVNMNTFSKSILKWHYLIVTNLFKPVCFNHFFLVPCCAFEAFTSILYVLVPRTTSVRCRSPKTHSYPPKFRNPEFLMSQFGVVRGNKIIESWDKRLYGTYLSHDRPSSQLFCSQLSQFTFPPMSQHGPMPRDVRQIRFLLVASTHK